MANYLRTVSALAGISAVGLLAPAVYADDVPPRVPQRPAPPAPPPRCPTAEPAHNSACTMPNNSNCYFAPQGNRPPRMCYCVAEANSTNRRWSCMDQPMAVPGPLVPPELPLA